MTENPDHRFLKEEIACKYSRKGYETEKERKIENGMIVDVVAENDEKTIFFEVGTLNGENRVEELKKYADKVVHNPQFGKPTFRNAEGIMNLSLGGKHKEKLREIAEDRHRSMTNQIRWWIEIAAGDMK